MRWNVKRRPAQPQGAELQRSAVLAACETRGEVSWGGSCRRSRGWCIGWPWQIGAQIAGENFAGKCLLNLHCHFGSGATALAGLPDGVLSDADFAAQFGLGTGNLDRAVKSFSGCHSAILHTEKCFATPFRV